MSTLESLTTDAQAEQRANDRDVLEQYRIDVEHLEEQYGFALGERSRLHDQVTQLQIANTHLTADNESLKLEVERLRKLRHELDARIDRLQRALTEAL